MPLIKNYLSLIKFSHTVFAMPFALIGFALGAAQHPLVGLVGQWNINRAVGWASPGEARERAEMGIKFLLVVACMVFARSAAMAFNRYLDREFDARNPRTAIREIPKGLVSARSALLFSLVSCMLFLVACFFINSLCFYLSPVALFIVLGYSYTKRFTPLCHLVLGVGLSLAPIGAYLAVTGVFALLPVLFSFTVIFWVSGFDIIYALQDEEFDKSQRLYSMASWLGKSPALRVSAVFHSVSFLFVAAAGLVGHFGLWYWAGVCLFSGMLVYQHSLVKPNDLSRVNRAFMTANGIASVAFALFVLTDLLVHG